MINGNEYTPEQFALYLDIARSKLGTVDHPVRYTRVTEGLAADYAHPYPESIHEHVMARAREESAAYDAAHPQIAAHRAEYDAAKAAATARESEAVDA